MFLKHLGVRPLRDAARDDEGVALAAVMALTALLLIVSIAIASATLTSTAFSTGTRADVQSQAAADAGIDAAYASISKGTYVCSASSSVAPKYSVTVKYNGASCTGTFSGTPTTAVVTSTGTAAANGLRSTDGNTATVAANLTFATTSTVSTLTNVVYSGGALTLPNNVTLAESASGAKDASVYTPGSLSCNTQSSIQGNVIAQGSISIPNTCGVTGYVWTAGAVNVQSSSASVEGDVYAAGSAAVGPGHVGGAVIAAGAVTVDNGGKTACSGLTGTWSVCGTVASLQGAVTFSNGGNTGGSAYAAGAIDLGSANSTTIVNKDVVSSGGNLSASNASGTTVGSTAKVYGTVSGLTTARVGSSSGSCQYSASSPFTRCSSAPTIPSTPNPADTFPSGLGYPSTVNAPATQTMPTIANTTAALNQWQSAGWTVVNKTSCADARSYLDSMSTSTPNKTLLNVTNCSSQLYWTNGAQLTVYNDLAIMNPGGFKFDNNAGAKSNSSTFHQLELIVPTGSSGGISTDNTTFSNLYTLLFTPGTITMSNGITGFSGQIYGGSVSGPGTAATLTMHTIDVPVATTTGTSGGSASTTVSLSSRYDVAG